jgi:hypothetical protein
VTVQRESQCLQSIIIESNDGLLDIFRPNFEEGHQNFAGIETQAEQSQSNLYIFGID